MMSARRESGIAMLEVLIAILIMSFGLLGVAGMQLVGMRSTNTSYLRSVATFQAYDMTDRMRANMSAVKATSNNYSNISCAGTNTSPSCAAFDSTGCSITDIRNYDASAWCAANARLLPGGGGTVTSVTNSNAFLITVSWTEKCETGESGCSAGTYTRTFNTQFVP